MQYVNGRGCRQSDTDAVQWYNRASNHGHEEARKRLGALYRQGRGVKVSTGATPLFVGASEGRVDVVKVLLEQGVDIDEGLAYSRTTPLAAAARGGHVECVDILLKHDAAVNRTTTDDGSSPFMFAALNGHVRVMELLLDTGQIEIDKPREFDDVTPLMATCYYGHTEAAKLLLERGADANYVREKDGVTVLFMAAQRGYLEIVKLLLWGVENYVAPIVEDDETTIGHHQHKSSSFFNSPFAKHAPVSPKAGSYPGSPSSPGMSPTSEHNAALALLSPKSPQFGAHVVINEAPEPESVFTNSPRTPRIDVNVATKTANCTPLVMAAQNGHLNIVKHLLKAKANVNIAKMDDGASPLIMAAQNDHPEIARVLIEAEADKEYKSMYGTPLVIAKRHKREDVKAVLEYEPPEEEEVVEHHGLLGGMGSMFGGGKKKNVKSPTGKGATSPIGKEATSPKGNNKPTSPKATKPKPQVEQEDTVVGGNTIPGLHPGLAQLNKKRR